MRLNFSEFFFKSIIQWYTAYKKLTLNIVTNRFKVKSWIKIFHANTSQKNSGVAILML